MTGELMIAQFMNGAFHRALDIGGGYYLLPFEKGEVYVVEQLFTRLEGRKNSRGKLIFSLRGKGLPYVWDHTVGSRQGLIVLFISPGSKTVPEKWVRCTYGRISSRVVKLIEEEIDDPGFSGVRHFDPDYRRNNQAPPHPYELMRYSFHEDAQEHGNFVKTDDVIGVPLKEEGVESNLVEVFEAADVPYIPYGDSVLAIYDEYPIISSNLREGCWQYKNANCCRGEGFGTYVLLDFHGVAVAFLSHRGGDYAKQKHPLGLLNKEQALAAISQARRKQKARMEGQRLKKLERQARSYELKDHNGMVVCMAIMHDGSERVAAISEIEQDWQTKMITVRLNRFYDSITVNPFEHPFVEENGLKGFFASSTDLGKEAERVAKKRKKSL